MFIAFLFFLSIFLLIVSGVLLTAEYKTVPFDNCIIGIRYRFFGVLFLISSFIVIFSTNILLILVFFCFFPIYAFSVSEYSDTMFEPIRIFNKIYNNSKNNPEQKITFKIFKRIYLLYPDSFCFKDCSLCYVTQNHKYKKFYMTKIDLFRTLKFLYKYRTTKVYNDRTPITDDILDRLKKEKQKAQEEQDAAISNIKKIYENYNDVVLK